MLPICGSLCARTGQRCGPHSPQLVLDLQEVSAALPVDVENLLGDVKCSIQGHDAYL